MLFSRSTPIIGAMLAGLAAASPLVVPNLDLPVSPAKDLAVRTTDNAAWDMARRYDNKILYAGIAIPETQVELDVALVTLATAGGPILELGDGFLTSPLIKLSLEDIKVYLELDIYAGAQITTTLEIFASEALEVLVPGLADVKLGALFALDLTLDISAAIELTAGLAVSFGKGCFLEIDIVKGVIVNANLETVVASLLDVNVGADVDLAAAISVNFGLQLRTCVGLSADLDIIGLPIGVGAEVIVWVNIWEFAVVIVAEVDNAVSASVVAVGSLSACVYVEVDVDIAALGLDIDIAPTVCVSFISIGINTTIPIGGYPGQWGPHPGPGLPHPGGGDDGSWTTSTYTTTETYTYTSCAPTVTNCPKDHTTKVCTSTVKTTTTVCPVDSSTYTAPWPTSTGSSTTASSLPAPTTKTCTIPEGYPTPTAPTVTVTESVSSTYCPESSASASYPHGGYPSGTAPAESGHGGYPHPSGSGKPYPPKPTGTGVGYPTAPASSTYVYPTPSATPSQVVTAGAGSMKVSAFALMAAPAVLAALL